MSERDDVDWTGVAPSSAPISPLTPVTFVERLRTLTAAVNGLARLEKAFQERQANHGDRLSATPGKPR